MKNDDKYEVVIIGGSYAGLSAGMTLGRALRRTLIIDNGKPCNRQTPFSHNFITHDGATPSSIASSAKEQVLRYPTVKFSNHTVVDAVREQHGFTIMNDDGTTVRTRKLLFATGIQDLIHDIPGISACWGISVLHCPYCHGYEVKGKVTGVLANGDMGFEIVKLIDHWTDQLTLFTNGPSTLAADQTDKIKAHNIQIIEKEIREIDHAEGMIRKMIFKDGSAVDIEALYMKVPFRQHTDIPVKLGCNLTDTGYIQTDDFQMTTVPGVYAAGDNTTMLRSVSVAVASGMKAAAFLNKALIEEDFH